MERLKAAATANKKVSLMDFSLAASKVLSLGLYSAIERVDKTVDSLAASKAAERVVLTAPSLAYSLAEQLAVVMAAWKDGEKVYQVVEWSVGKTE